MEFRLLGPVEVWVDGRRLELGRADTAKARCVLAVLLHGANAMISTETLGDRVWGAQPVGPSARYKYVGWLRSALAPHGVELTRRDEGYALRVDPGLVDLHRFRGRVAAARRALADGDRPEAARLLREALGEWRGQALGGLSGVWAELTRSQLERERRDAFLLHASVGLELGRHDELIAELAGFETEYPTDARVTELLMLALYRSGRRDQALRCYRDAAERTRAELDADPDDALRELHRRVEARDPSLGPAGAAAAHPGFEHAEHGEGGDAADAPDGRNTVTAPEPVVPRQLPGTVRHFVGRSAELGELSRLLAEAHEPGQDAMAIATVSGTAGVGKTALAVHWARQVADRFPDGQLYLNLRGFDPSGRPVAAAEAIRDLIDAFGLETARIPASGPAQTALYRSLLADRRVLLLLDNARDAEQVRPLLPGGSRCFVIVTSRSRLDGLVAAEGARPVAVDVLSHDAARDLLVRRLGTERADAEHGMLDELIERCARLPLALNVVAARAATRPALRVREIAAMLRDTPATLDALDAGDRATDVRSVLSWSYRQLGPAAARMFRLLGLHAGQDISPAAAAALAGVRREAAGAALDELVTAHLATERTPGRYASHDLLRAFAGECAQAGEDEPERRAAVRRLLDYYLHAAHAATLLLDPHRDLAPLDPPSAGVVPEEPADYAEALRWFEAEHQVLLAVVEQASTNGFHDVAWYLPWTVEVFLDRGGHWHEWVRVLRTALAAAGARGDRAGEARAQRSLGRAYAVLGQPDEARAHLGTALGLYQRIGEQRGQGVVHLTLCWSFQEQDRHAEALFHGRHALDVFTAGDLTAGRANALNAIGWSLAHIGDHEQGIATCRQALALFDDLGDLDGVAASHDSLGYAQQRAGRHAEALASCRRALDMFRELGNVLGQAEALAHLGDAHHLTGDTETARAEWSAALAIMESLGRAQAAEVRAKLAAC